MPAYVQRKAPRSPVVSSARVRAFADRMLLELELEQRELSVLLTDDGFIQGLNHAHRGKDRPTDVLAFPLDEDVDEGKPAGPLTSKARPGRTPRAASSPRRRRAAAPADPMLGDVIISLDTAKRQARQRRHTLLDEVCFLLAHGLLHLIGYDHQNDADEREMNEMTVKLVTATRQRARLAKAKSKGVRRR